MASASEHRPEDPGAAQQRFLSLFLRSEREIYRYVAALIPNVKDAEDIVQQTALALWEKFDAYDPARPFTPWACRFALNKARQWIARHQQPGTVHWLIRNDGVLGLTVFRLGPQNFQILASPPVLTLDQFGMWLKLAVVLDGRTRQVVHYVDGLPVSRHTLRQRPPFRLGKAELGNWIAPSGRKAASFQIRNFSGSFDEFVLFSRALTDAEIRELYLQGKPDP